MGVGLVGVQHHHVAVVRQFGLGKLARGLQHDASLGTGRDGQHDVERLAAFADIRDARAAETPLIGDRAQGLLAFTYGTAVVFDRQSPCLGDVAQVGRNGTHATPTAGHLDHHLRHAALDRRADALTQGLGTLLHRQVGQRWSVRRLAAAVRGIEQPVEPVPDSWTPRSAMSVIHGRPVRVLIEPGPAVGG